MVYFDSFIQELLSKDILGNIKKAEIKYISAGKYNITKQAEDPKKADHELTKILEDISKKAKKLGMEFKIKEKK